MKSNLMMSLILSLSFISINGRADNYPDQCATYSPNRYTITEKECNDFSVEKGAPYYIWDYRDWALVPNAEGFRVKAAKCLLCGYK